MAGVPKFLLNLITSNKSLPEYILLSTIVAGTILSTRDYGTNKKSPLWVEGGRFSIYRQQTHKYTSGDDIIGYMEKNRAG